MATCYNNLGNAHNLGDLEQAKENYERALTIRLKKLDPDHLDVALGDLEQAKENYERALTIYLKKLFTRPWVTWSRPKRIMNVHLLFI